MKKANFVITLNICMCTIATIIFALSQNYYAAWWACIAAMNANCLRLKETETQIIATLAGIRRQ